MAPSKLLLKLATMAAGTAPWGTIIMAWGFVGAAGVSFWQEVNASIPKMAANPNNFIFIIFFFA